MINMDSLIPTCFAFCTLQCGQVMLIGSGLNSSTSSANTMGTTVAWGGGDTRF